MSHEQSRMARPVVQFAQPAPEIATDLGVERAERLVQQEHTRVDGKGARKRDALTLPARELGGTALAKATQLHEIEKFADAAVDLGAGRTCAPRPHAQPIRHVLRHRLVPEERVMLEDEADTALAHRQARGVLVIEQQPAGCRRLEARDQAQQRGLARAGGAEQCQQLTGLDNEIEAVDCQDIAEGLAQTLGADRGGGAAPRDVSVAGWWRARLRVAIRGGTCRPG